MAILYFVRLVRVYADHNDSMRPCMSVDTPPTDGLGEW